MEAYRTNLPAQIPVVPPVDADALHARALQRWNRGEHRGALADFGRAIESDPAHVQSWINRGLCRALSLRDFVGARSDFERAFQLAPENPVVWGRHALVLQDVGDLDAAIKAATRAIERGADRCRRVAVAGALPRDQG